MRLLVTTPEGTLYDGEATKVSMPGTLAPFMVLPRHARFISSLVKGKISFVNEEGYKEIAIREGFVEVCNDVVNACVEI